MLSYPPPLPLRPCDDTLEIYARPTTIHTDRSTIEKQRRIVVIHVTGSENRSPIVLCQTPNIHTHTITTYNLCAYILCRKSSRRRGSRAYHTNAFTMMSSNARALLPVTPSWRWQKDQLPPIRKKNHITPRHLRWPWKTPWIRPQPRYDRCDDDDDDKRRNITRHDVFFSDFFYTVIFFLFKTVTFFVYIGI
jgi:hypothetical protein